MRLKPDPAVLAWFSGHDSAGLYLTAVTKAELRAGAAILPVGHRRNLLTAEVDAMVREDFAGSVLPFDSAAARAYGDIAAARRSLGRPILEADCQMTAIARTTDAAVAASNIADSEPCGIALIDPWTDSVALP